MKRMLLIGGTMGVGKTAVCQQLKIDLPNSVFLDGDWCWDADPFWVTDETKSMVLDNICFLLNNFMHCSAYENLIFCWVMHEQAIINSILSRIDTANCITKCFSLVADEATIRSRLTADIIKGVRMADIISKSVARLPLYQSLNTIKINTIGKTVEEISHEIRAMAEK